jgi:hypothetical protein
MLQKKVAQKCEPILQFSKKTPKQTVDHWAKIRPIWSPCRGILPGYKAFNMKYKLYFIISYYYITFPIRMKLCTRELIVFLKVYVLSMKWHTKEQNFVRRCENLPPPRSTFSIFKNGPRPHGLYTSSGPGCQIFLATTYQNWENIPNHH